MSKWDFAKEKAIVYEEIKDWQVALSLNNSIQKGNIHLTEVCVLDGGQDSFEVGLESKNILTKSTILSITISVPASLKMS